jgi:hypothetical protein
VADRDPFTACARKLDKRPNSSSSAIEHGESAGARQAAENAPSIVPSRVRRRTHSGKYCRPPNRVAAPSTPAIASDAQGPGSVALDDDWPQVLAALRRGLADKDAGKAARTAVAYVQLVYGRQLQQPADETPPSVEALDVSRMTIAERELLKRRILARHPHLAEEILGEDA